MAGLIAVSVTATLVAQLRTFHQTSNGDWETTIENPDGTSLLYTFVPATKFTARLASALSVSDIEKGVIDITYTIKNEEGSHQSVAALLINPGNRQRIPMTLLETPGWDSAQAGAYTTFRSIAPGEQGRLSFRTQALPGVVVAALSSSVEPLDIPDNLTDRQRNELEFLSTRNTDLPTNAIGPSIKVIGESWTAVTNGVLRHYRQQFETSKHPGSQRLTLASLRPEDNSPERIAADLAAIAAMPTTDKWHAELSDALGTCARMLTKLKYPVPPIAF